MLMATLNAMMKAIIMAMMMAMMLTMTNSMTIQHDKLLLGFLSVAAQTLQQQKHPIHSEVQKKFGFPTELLVDVVCVTCSAHAFVVATHATHHLPLLLKFLKNIEGKPQTNTEKREEKHKLQDQRAKAAEVKEGQIEPPTRTSTHRQNSEPMNNPH